MDFIQNASWENSFLFKYTVDNKCMEFSNSFPNSHYEWTNKIITYALLSKRWNKLAWCYYPTSFLLLWTSLVFEQTEMNTNSEVNITLATIITIIDFNNTTLLLNTLLFYYYYYYYNITIIRCCSTNSSIRMELVFWISICFV